MVLSMITNQNLIQTQPLDSKFRLLEESSKPMLKRMLTMAPHPEIITIIKSTIA